MNAAAAEFHPNREPERQPGFGKCAPEFQYGRPNSDGTTPAVKLDIKTVCQKTPQCTSVHRKCSINQSSNHNFK